MTIGSGLAASINIGRESEFGVPVAAHRSLEFVSESLNHERTVTESSSLRVGRQVADASRRRISHVSASGDIEFEVASRGFGMLFEAALGTAGTPTAVSGTAAQRRDFTIGELVSSYTIQKLVPTSAGDLTAITFPGMRCTGAEFSIAVGELLTATFSWDGRTALLDDGTTLELGPQPTSYPASGGGYSFRDGSLLIREGGGSTWDTLGAVREATVGIETPLAVERHFLGGGGLKARQVQNGLRTISGSLTAEYVDNQLLGYYLDNVEFGMRLTFLGAEIATGVREELTFTLPAVFLEGSTPQVGGPDIVEFGGDYVALAPADGTSPLTISTVTLDTDL